jgi:hypothetical protein
VFGAGGAAANGFITSLRRVGGYHIIAANTDPTDLQLAAADEHHVVGPSGDDLWGIITATKPDFVHAQPDEEVLRLSRYRGVVRGCGARYLLPDHPVVVFCQDKWETYERLSIAQVPAPVTWLLGSGHEYPPLSSDIWVRPRTGAGGKGAARTTMGKLIAEDGPVQAGTHTAAYFLPGPTVTVQALYHQGELVASQGRLRLAWTHGDRGSCRIGQTVSDPVADDVAERAVAAVDPKPNGIYGIDMTLDREGQPRVTEINIGRFFTTVDFFSAAGLNLPHLYVQAAMTGIAPRLGRNPLQEGLQWLRQWDRPPLLVTP